MLFVGIGYFIFQIVLGQLLDNIEIMTFAADSLKVPYQDVKDYGASLGGSHCIGID